MLSNRELFAGTVDPFVTTLVILLTDMYTNKQTGEIEWLNWDIETIKMDQEEWEADMVLNMGQILSIPFVLIGIAVLVRAIILNRKANKQA